MAASVVGAGLWIASVLWRWRIIEYRPDLPMSERALQQWERQCRGRKRSPKEV